MPSYLMLSQQEPEATVSRGTAATCLFYIPQFYSLPDWDGAAAD